MKKDTNALLAAVDEATVNLIKTFPKNLTNNEITLFQEGFKLGAVWQGAYMLSVLQEES